MSRCPRVVYIPDLRQVVHEVAASLEERMLLILLRVVCVGISCPCSVDIYVLSATASLGVEDHVLCVTSSRLGPCSVVGHGCPVRHPLWIVVAALPQA